MYQLICHHTYDTWDGLAVDRSAYGLSNGRRRGQPLYAVDGVEPGSGALTFLPGDAVSVPSTAAWQALGTLDLEMVLRLDRGASSRVFIDADQSFRIAGDLLSGGGPGFSYSAIATRVEWVTPSGGVLQLFGPEIEFDRWTKLRLSYDGFATLTLSVDDRSKSTAATQGVLPVGPRGCNIGGSIDRTRALGGALDEVRVWRFDPQSGRETFLGRPFTDESAQCWVDALTRLRDQIAADPDSIGPLLARLHDAARAQIGSAMAVQGSEAAQLDAIVHRYGELWRAGQLDSDDMTTVLAQFFEWWRRHIGLAQEEITPAIEGLRGLIGIDVSCDPEFTAFVRRVGDAFESVA